VVFVAGGVALPPGVAVCVFLSVLGGGARLIAGDIGGAEATRAGGVEEPDAAGEGGQGAGWVGF
jgi:hypothetical protein